MIIWIIAILCFATVAVVLVVVFKVFGRVSVRLAVMEKTLETATRSLGDNIGTSVAVFGAVGEKLGRLEETNRQMVEMSKDIGRLQDLLRVPKLRGQIGEQLLENLLAQVLPQGFFTLQYRFKSADAVDAVIKLGGKLVSIDAKFSLENFVKSLDARDEQEALACRKKFLQDVKNRIDEIATKYIQPQENTFDFALMYVPAENVYYEMIVHEDIFTYGLARKVIPVSPNTLYAYLQVICLGLRGMQVEKNAVEILKGLNGLQQEFIRLREDFSLLGAHLSNAGRKFDDSQKHLERFGDKLTSLENHNTILEK